MKKNNRYNALNKERKKANLTFGMIRLLVICLVVPFGALSVVLFFSSASKTSNQVRNTVVTSMENAAENCNSNIEKVIQESKQASYDNVIRTSYLQFLKDKNEAVMYREISSYLSEKYKYNSMISSTIVVFKEKTTMEYYTYSNVAGATYASISDFKNNAMTQIKSVAQRMGTNTKFIEIGEHLYLVRNLVTSDYNPYAIIVMEINKSNMFKSMDNVVWRENGAIFLDGDMVCEPDYENDINNEKFKIYADNNKRNYGEVTETESNYDSNNYTVNLYTRCNNQQFTYIVKLNRMEVLNESFTYVYIYVLIILITILLAALTFYYFYRNINKPISDLMEMSEKIEEGEYGITLPAFEGNKEFGKLIDTFNHMSLGLEESFNRIYAEEVALRDANMQALQSQINPHFLNNTLEIINWKARMSGNYDVSGMIESLGVMMEATMNRKKEKFITIEEELKYVDAYLYIIHQRFGSRFHFDKDVDENLLNLKIPRLIVQPIVENAVEHGGDKEGNIIGSLKIYADYNNLYIVVHNNGNMTEADKAKIEILLSDQKLEENVHNIGIRNVNMRLKLLYGENSGLSIENIDDNLTESKLKIDRFKMEN
ncbi:sensor histidine kinase [uncultured Eubacterium sp.]|uniref:sensor histidine kinase n=1 Tax=uncultured Eubacterium sp. TaxID=165185 RepID=UPI0026DC7193|nr:histidine kinase [uncultured Eubacterium sp.]